ncbi:MAG TPA: GntR family transcriptional regulator, partial [Burkholderiaceae bacterium]|nr:GntR family transcriptional regulator [Burkholderiaceae bacterium]
MSTSLPEVRRRPRTLALELVESLGDRIRDGRIAPGDKLPTEAAIMGEFGVSRTVVREALSKLQASGLVETRHGIGTFVVGFGDGAPFRIAPEQMATLRDVIAVLELRIGIETEAAALAARRRTEGNL